ncbi:MAG: peptidoglycan DD-metalloendopeptidase family protein [Candidatus Wenzhouxiangella sp. M2_3B_020]
MRPRILATSIVFTALAFSATIPAQGYGIYEVRVGDTLGRIAERYRTSVATVMAFNDLENDTLVPATRLRVPIGEARGGVLERAPALPPGFRTHRLVPGDTLTAIAERNGTSVTALVGANPDLASLDDLPAGTELLIPPEAGLLVTLEDPSGLPALLDRYAVLPGAVVRANAIAGPADLLPGMLLFLPAVEPRDALARLREVRDRERPYGWPVQGVISSYFGRRNLGMGTAAFHAAIDIAAPSGTPVFAARSGVVTYAGWSGGYGKLVRIRHEGGGETWYAHNRDLLVAVGERVRRGQPVARVGSTGLSTGPHVHFEIRERGRAVNPLAYLR